MKGLHTFLTVPLKLFIMYSLEPCHFITLVSGCSIKCEGTFKIETILFGDFGEGAHFCLKTKMLLTVHYVISACLRDSSIPGSKEVWPSFSDENSRLRKAEEPVQGELRSWLPLAHFPWDDTLYPSRSVSSLSPCIKILGCKWQKLTSSSLSKRGGGIICLFTLSNFRMSWMEWVFRTFRIRLEQQPCISGSSTLYPHLSSLSFTIGFIFFLLQMGFLYTEGDAMVSVNL